MEYYNNDVIFLNNIFNAVDKGGTIVIFQMFSKVILTMMWMCEMSCLSLDVSGAVDTGHET